MALIALAILLSMAELRADAADDALAAAADHSPSLDLSVTTALDLLSDKAQQLRRDLLAISENLRRLQVACTSLLHSTDALRVATYGLVLLIIGAGSEWLYWCYMARSWRSIAEAAAVGSASDSLPASAATLLAMRRASLEACGLLVFSVMAIGASSAFVWPPVVHQAIVVLAFAVAGARAILLIARFILSPHPSRLRLVLLEDHDARRLYRATIGLGVIIAVLYVADGVTVLIDDLPGLSLLGRASAGLAIALLSLSLLGPQSARRRGDTSIDGRALRRFAATVLIILFFFLYLLDLRQMVASIGVIFVAGVADRVLRGMVEPFTASSTASATGDAGVFAASWRSVLYRAFDIGIFSVVVFCLAVIWDVPVFALARSGTPTGKLLDIAIVLLIANLVWVWARTAIDRRLAAIPVAADHQNAPPGTRLATLLPLLRKALLIVVATVTLLIALSALGLDIAPLLAGASVVGIAIGFGAQTLVRDIVSGVFYLLEDTFRVGEYVEFGNIRGTVEAISLRFIRLRHHRGAVHTIPFGEVRWLTNHSRDWVIMKLDFHVPFSTDIEFVRQVIKEVGTELLQDPELGPSFIEPVKSRGVIRFEEYCMVIGVKFTALADDGRFLIRRAAYHRIRDAFVANGIRFYERNVEVRVAVPPVDGLSRPSTATAPASVALLGAGADSASG